MFENLIPYWARARPGAPAIILPSGNISFRQFEDTIQAMAAALAEWPLPPGSKIVVSDTRPFVHWATIFALDRLGHVSISDDRSSSALGIASVAGVVAESADRAPPGRPTVVTDRAWLDRALRMPRWPPSMMRHAPTDRVRILLSSGTTGRPKQCLLTRAIIDTRATRRAAVRPHFNSIYSTAMGLGTTGGFLPAIGSWTSGGAVAYGTVSLTDTLVRLKPNHVLVSPQHLALLMRELPSSFTRRDDLTLMIGGSATPSVLTAEARARLTPDVRLLYASTEAGSITSIDSASPITAHGGVGYANVWARFEIVDAEGRQLPSGETGIVRVAGDEVIEQYDEEPNHPALRDGWFYPGDVGSMHPDGMITISGRTDDVLNVGGEKVSAFDLEQQLLQIPGVLEAAVVPTHNAYAEINLLAAVVIAEDVPFEAVNGQIRNRARYRLSVTQLPALPRNDMGKVIRKELEAALVAAGAPERSMATAVADRGP